jgi:predicted ATP-dependent serine protease
MAFFSNSNIVATKHRTMAFKGKWFDSFGTPPTTGSWIIYGASGSGKTTFALQLAKYLTNFNTVLYWSLEQGNSAAFQKIWLRERMQDCGTKIMLADDTSSFEGIIGQLNQRKGRGILIVDSITPLKYYSEEVGGVMVTKQFGVINYERIRKRLKNKLIIFLSHEKGGIPDTNVGDYILKLADLKMRAEGFKIMTNARSGDKMKDFIVWERGAMEYWVG